MRIKIIAICASIAFVVFASFDNVHGWPLIVPFIAGIVVMNRKSNAERKGYGSILKTILFAAFVTIILAFISLWFFAKDAITNSLKEAGYSLSDDSIFPLVMVAVVLGVIFFITFLIGTGLGALISPNKRR